MPTYEYECKSCGTLMDVFQAITAAPLRKTFCDSCGQARPVRRLISAGGAVLFKGSGFYQTDYRSESYNKAAQAESGNGEASSHAKDKKDTSPAVDKAKSKSSKAPRKQPDPRP